MIFVYQNPQNSAFYLCILIYIVNFNIFVFILHIYMIHFILLSYYRLSLWRVYDLSFYLFYYTVYTYIYLSLSINVEINYFKYVLIRKMLYFLGLITFSFSLALFRNRLFCFDYLLASECYWLWIDLIWLIFLFYIIDFFRLWVLVEYIYKQLSH